MVVCNKRKVRYLWSAAIISTIAACSVFVYVSLLFGNHSYSEERSLKGFSSKAEKLTEEKCIPVCNSEECLYQSKFLLQRMEPVADPCENFFEFACGKYTEQFEGETRNFASEATLEMQQSLKNLLENSEADPESLLGKLKTLYNSCINPSSSDSQAIPTFLKYLASFGIPNWPYLKPDFQFVEPSRTHVLANIIKYKEFGFCDVFVTYESQMIPHSQINVTFSSMENAYEKKEKSIRKYLLENVLQYFDLDAEAVNEMWEETEPLHDAVMHLKEENENKTDYSEDLVTIDCEVDTETEWKPLCEVLESFAGNADAGVDVSKRFAYVCEDSAYFLQNIFPLLRNFSDRSIANYLTLNILFNHLDELNLYFRLTFQNDPDSFNDYLRTPLQIGQWQHCVDWLIKNMFIPLAHVYLTKVFTVSSKDEVNGLIQECIQETAEAVSKQEWIPEALRIESGKAIENIENDLSILGLMLQNETLINNLYNQFEPTDASFLRNVFEHQSFTRSESMRGGPLAAGWFSYRSSFLEAKALGGGGSIVINLGILLPPVYRSGLHRLINLVTLATIVAHEIGHNLHESSNRLDKLDQGAKDYRDNAFLCLENQYSHFRFESIGKNMNGSRSLRENIADTVAISVIDKFIEKYTFEDDLLEFSGFSYSQREMLYISAAQVWCEAQTKKDEEHSYHNAVHSPGKFRLIGMMQNSRGFSEAFNCSERSYMNPATKCIFLQ